MVTTVAFVVLKIDEEIVVIAIVVHVPTRETYVLRW
tara:strand:+ start:126 stop:233 length:108 start_codon:yes stop_codon:yes gene_type:complete